jgi:hypothetical protein
VNLPERRDEQVVHDQMSCTTCEEYLVSGDDQAQAIYISGPSSSISEACASAQSLSMIGPPSCRPTTIGTSSLCLLQWSMVIVALEQEV